MYHDSVDKCKKSILELVEANPEAKLLDLGCNDGIFTTEIAKKIGTKKVYGVEINPKGVKQSKKQKIKVFSYDLNKKFPFPSNYFDVITANQIIEHLYNTDGFVQEIRRVLKPKGYTIISTNNLASWHNIISLLFGYQPISSDISNWTNIGKIFTLSKEDKGSFSHLRIFTMKALHELLEYHKLRVFRKKGIGYYPLTGKFSKILSDFDLTHSVYITLMGRK